MLKTGTKRVKEVKGFGMGEFLLYLCKRFRKEGAAMPQGMSLSENIERFTSDKQDEVVQESK